MKRHVQTVSRRAALAGYVAVVLLMSAGAATGLSGSNTVFSDDIVNNTVSGSDVRNESLGTPDIANGSLIGADIRNDSITGADVDESSLAIPKVYAVRVDTEGTVTVISGVATQAGRTGTGVYRVFFPFSVANCAATATSSSFTEELGPAPAYLVTQTAAGSDPNPLPNEVRVHAFIGNAGVSDVSGFALTVVC